jgi:hypothetical protein
LAENAALKYMILESEEIKRKISAFTGLMKGDAFGEFH